MRIWIRNTTFFSFKFVDLQFADWDSKETCGFAICGLIITNLRLANWDTSEICGFAIAQGAKEFADLQYAD
jgi:hypothetical protein